MVPSPIEADPAERDFTERELEDDELMSAAAVVVCIALLVVVVVALAVFTRLGAR